MTEQELKSKLEAAEACCAEFREILQLCVWMKGHDQRISHAISSDCGKDFIRKSEVKPLVEALNRCAMHSRDHSEVKFVSEQALAHAHNLGIEP